MTNGRTHRPEHDPASCEACGACTWRCPAAVFPELAGEAGSLRGAVFAARPYPGAKAAVPPCRAACPLGQDVPGYVSAVARGETALAGEIVRRTNALPSVCGRLCLASCMKACVRARLDQGLDIRGLKRFAAEAARAAPVASIAATGRKVAIVGGGPAGLAAAHGLAQLGVRAVIFEAGPVAGGLLADAVPEFALPRDALRADVEALVAMGVEIRCNARVGRDVTCQELEAEFDAVLVATGAQEGVVPRVPGRELAGVTDVIGFSRKKGAAGQGGPVVVMGGGSAALLAARAAARGGATSTTLVHTSLRGLWPAGEDALALAEADGVAILAERRVVRLEGEGGALAAVVVARVRLAEPDRVGRVRALGNGAQTRLEARAFVAAADRRPAAGDAPKLEGAARGPLGNLLVGQDTYRLGRDRWYAAGEAATGAATVVDSMGTGRLAALAIARDLGVIGGKP